MQENILHIDGSIGGGAVLRTALALSIATGRAFSIDNIRANRPKSGLMRQHLTCVRGSAEFTNAVVEGAELGSASLTFLPQDFLPQDRVLDIGSGGSTLLLLQSILSGLARRTGKPLHITVKGGTFCPMAPVGAFFIETLLPAMRLMGYEIEAEIVREGFYQTGGGEIALEICPMKQPRSFSAFEPVQTQTVQATVINCGLKADIAAREADVLRELMAPHFTLPEEFPLVQAKLREETTGNAVVIKIGNQAGVSVFSEIGMPKISAKTVAKNAATAALLYHRYNVPVCARLADQLLVPMTLAAGGRFLTTTPTAHVRATAEVIRLFTGKAIEMTKEEHGWGIAVPALGEMK